MRLFAALVLLAPFVLGKVAVGPRKLAGPQRPSHPRCRGTAPRLELALFARNLRDA
jgi:hypothetical protein